jgi:3-hydroxyacyl-[acyl-carrier-protein] dehydratase
MSKLSSKLTDETRGCLTQLTHRDDGALLGRFVFPPEYSGFNGHFSENPVLPGVCMVQAVIVMQEAWSHQRMTLGSVVSAKWLAPVKPGVELLFESEPPRAGSDESRGRVIKTRISCDGKKVAEVVLRESGPSPEKAGAS